MSANNQSMSVILCCARADAAHLRPLGEHLERKGIRARVVEGVEDDPHRVGSALDQETGACLFVACLSDTLGPKDFRRLTGIYNARKGPAHYLADIVVEPDELQVMAETIDGALARASKVIANPDRDKRSSARGATRLRDVVGVTDISAVAEPMPTTARKSKKKQQSEQLSEPEVGKDRAPLREQSVAGPYVISSLRGNAANETEAELAPESSTVAPVTTTASSRMPALLFVILVAVAGTAVLLMQDRDESTSAPGRGAPKPAVIAAEPPSPPSPVAAAPAQPATPAQPIAPVTPPATSELGEAPEPGVPVDEAKIIREAIAAGNLRSIDLILIANPETRASWREASTTCRRKSLDGVRGWRLPSLDELETIRNARMLDRDRYWSSTLATQVGDGHDHVFVLDLEARTLDPVSKDAADVRVLCVRAALP